MTLGEMKSWKKRANPYSLMIVEWLQFNDPGFSLSNSSLLWDSHHSFPWSRSSWVRVA
jgi:hypothetical protein